MATTKDRALSRQLGALFNLGAIRELTDGQLLERFARGDGEPAELAFAALVERHGAMVMRVCRSRLGDPHDAQDAFQATFLVLVEKARGLWVRDSLGPWLHQVALRTSSCARSAAIRRRRIERLAAEGAGSRGANDDPGAPELARILHEEIGRLPDRYRVPIVLCDLEGRTCEEAARVMGRPVGTIKCWRSRGRERLRDRLIRAGVAPSVAAGAALTADVARAAVPAAADQTARAAARILSDGMGAGMVPAPVSTLVKGVIRSMFLSKLRTATAGLCALTFLGAGIAAAVHDPGDDPRGAGGAPDAAPRRTSGLQPPPSVPKPASEGGESWPMSLRDAIRIGLDHCEMVRVISPGTESQPVGGEDPTRPAAAVQPIVIARLDADTALPRFKGEIIAHVRSVEQQYWNLAVAHVQLWASRQALDLAEDAMRREQARRLPGLDGKDGLTGARSRLERLRLDLVTRTSDVIDAERRLRFLLGLPPADNRRIVPITPPTEARLEPDWDRSVATMLENQPDILLARSLAKAAEGRGTESDLDRVAGTFLPGVAGSKGPAPSAEAAEGRADQLGRQKGFLQQVVHQTTHSLARFFLEIDANYKQFRKASELRTAAGLRLDTGRVDLEMGRITIDQFLDAVGEFTIAVAHEAQYKATYNISMVALEEAKGTLLDFDRITVAEACGGTPPANGRPGDAIGAGAHRPLAVGANERRGPGQDGAVSRASYQPPAPAPPDAAGPIPTAVPTPAGPGRIDAHDPEPDDAGKTYSFHLTIGSGARPFEIRGSFTVAPPRKKVGISSPTPSIPIGSGETPR